MTHHTAQGNKETGMEEDYEKTDGEVQHTCHEGVKRKKKKKNGEKWDLKR